MRTLLKVCLEVTASNKAIQENKLPEMIEGTLQKLKPEAAYFLPMDGLRTMLIIFDLKDPSDIPVIAEPFFIGANAKVDFYPVMNTDDMKKGIGEVMKNLNK